MLPPERLSPLTSHRGTAALKFRLQLAPTAWITAEKLAQQGLWFVLFAILGPLLGPTPYGLVAFAMVFVGCVENVLVEAGVEALVSLEVAGPEHYGAANLVGVGFGLLSGLVLALLAPALAFIEHDPALVPIMLALAFLPSLSAVTVVPTAYLRREGRFSQFALRAILGLSLGGAAGVAVALLGGGVFALVVQVLVQRLLEAAILWRAARPAARIGRHAGALADLRTCALNVAAARSWTWFTSQAPRFIVGAALGPTVLGLFTIAGRVSDVLTQVVLVPATQIARLELRGAAADAARLQAGVARLLKDLSIAAFPISFGAAAVAPVLFSDWLGPTWAPAATATSLFALSLCPWTLFYSGTAVFLALRRPALERRIQGALALSSVPATLLAVPFGLVAVASALLARLCLIALLPLAGLRTHVGQSFVRSARILAPALCASAAMGALVAASLPAAEHLAGRRGALPLLVLEGCASYGVLICALAWPDVARLIHAFSAVRGAGTAAVVES